MYNTDEVQTCPYKNSGNLVTGVSQLLKVLTDIAFYV